MFEAVSKRQAEEHTQDNNGQELQHIKVTHGELGGPSVEPEQRFEEGSPYFNIRDTKEHPAEHDQYKGIDVLNRQGRFLQQLAPFA